MKHHRGVELSVLAVDVPINDHFNDDEQQHYQSTTLQQVPYPQCRDHHSGYFIDVPGHDVGVRLAQPLPLNPREVTAAFTINPLPLRPLPHNPV